MKNLIITLLFLGGFTVANTQSVSAYVKSKVANETRSLCNQFDCTYYGNIKLTNSHESGKYLTVTGTVDYYSSNCKEVTANFRIKLKVILDELEVSCFQLKMPYCVWGAEVRMDDEYTIGCCGC